MSAQDPSSSGSSSAHPFSTGFLKAWIDQAGALQELLTSLVDRSSAGAPPSMPPHMAPWKNFVDGLGMGAFQPEEKFPGVPALGWSREYQETAGRLIDLAKQFQQRYAEFAQQNATVVQDAFSVMKKRLDASAAPPESPADLYDAWIDCAEGAYAQAAHTDGFARLLAELCNISSAFRMERGKLTEQIARHLDLPSRAEVDTLHHQVRALTNAMRAAPAAAPAKASKAAPKPRKKSNK